MPDCCVIIPCHHGKYIHDIVGKVCAQGAEHVIVVADRIKLSFPENPSVIVLDCSSGDGFQAGRCRDMALSYYCENSDIYGECPVIFIDEDCIPQADLIASHYSLLSHNIPVITCGRRLEQDIAWNDRRELGEMANLHLFCRRETIVQNPSLVKKCQVTWTCNMGMNWSAIRRVQLLMRRYFDTDRIFHPAFDGEWGGEDSFLGYAAWAAKVFMVYVPKGANGVKHMEHPRPSELYSPKFASKLNELADKLSRKLVTDPLPLEFFDI